MNQRANSLIGLMILLGLAVGRAGADPASPRIFWATQPGAEALDVADGGGNPFAGALTELLNREKLDYATLVAELPALTEKKSFGRQVPQMPPAPLDWRIRPVSAGEKRVGLIVMFSDYPAEGSVPSLPGARKDAIRLTAAFKAAGFETQTLLNPKAEELRKSLKTFAAHSAEAAAAAIYVTGHGAEINGAVYLLPGEYPFAAGESALSLHAVALTEWVSALWARRVNLLFYGGCRDNPF
ncbi:MAG: caspase family protein [Kiritimatiellia bacterium]|nr:caspase family protein [Kiritimatiellia bacterium]